MKETLRGELRPGVGSDLVGERNAICEDVAFRWRSEGFKGIQWGVGNVRGTQVQRPSDSREQRESGTQKDGQTQGMKE